MKQFKNRKVNKQILKSVTCNCCGEDIKDTFFSDDEFYAEYISIDVRFGYFAKMFEDGERHNSDICEQCYANWIKTFKHHPKIN